MDQRTSQSGRRTGISTPPQRVDMNQLTEQLMVAQQHGTLPANMTREEAVLALKQITESGLGQITNIVSSVRNSNDFRIQYEEEIEIED